MVQQHLGRRRVSHQHRIVQRRVLERPAAARPDSRSGLQQQSRGHGLVQHCGQVQCLPAAVRPRGRVCPVVKQVRECAGVVLENSDVECGAAVALQLGEGVLLLDDTAGEEDDEQC